MFDIEAKLTLQVYGKRHLNQAFHRQSIES